MVKYFFNKFKDKKLMAYEQEMLDRLRKQKSCPEVCDAYCKMIEDFDYSKLQALAYQIRGDEKISDFIKRLEIDKIVPFFIKSGDDKKAYFSYVDQLNKMQCSRGTERKACRINSHTPFVYEALELVYGYFVLSFYDVTLKEYLKREIPAEKSDTSKTILYCLDDIIAATLDYESSVGKNDLEQAIEEIILGENNTAIVTADIIRGICKSSSKKLYELLGKYLLAARLQEGVRQAVCENMDCGRVEAFITLFNVIHENNLIRFSSVKRAVATWIGICNTESLDRISNKTIELMHQVLNDKTKSESMLETDDAMQILVGLWCKGFYDVYDAVTSIKKLIDSDSRIKKLVAAYYCYYLKTIPFVQPLNASIINYGIEKSTNDKIVLAAFLESYLNYVHMDIYYIRQKLNDALKDINGSAVELPDGKKKINKLAECVYFPEYFNYCSTLSLCAPFETFIPPVSNYYESEEKIEKHFDIVYNLFETLKKKKEVYNEITFPWNQISISKEELGSKLCFMAILNPKLLDKNKQRVFNALLMTENEFNGFLLNPSDMETRKFVFENIRAIKSVSLNIIGSYETDSLTDKEIDSLIKVLKYKDSELKNKVLLILKKFNKGRLNETVSILLSSKESETRFCGLDLIASATKDETISDKLNPNDFKELISGIKNPEEKETVLINQILDSTATDEKTFLFYDKKNITAENIPAYDSTDFDKEIFDKKCEDKINKILSEFDRLIKENQTREYTDIEGENHTLGEKQDFRQKGFLNYIRENNDFALPFMDLWKSFFEKNIRDYKTVFQIWLLNVINQERVYSNNGAEQEPLKKIYSEYFGEDFSKIKIIETEYYNPRTMNSLFATVYLGHMFCFKSFDTDNKIMTDISEIKKKFFLSVCHKVATDSDVEKYIYKADENVWYYRQTSNKKSIINTGIFRTIDDFIPNSFVSLSDEEFKNYFNMIYAIHRNKGFDEIVSVLGYMDYAPYLSFLDYVRAYGLNLISKDTVYYAVFNLLNLMSTVNDWRQIQKKKYFSYASASIDEAGFNEIKKNANEIMANISERLIFEELNRGEQPAEHSEYVTNFYSYSGIENALKLLKAFGKEKFVRSCGWAKENSDRSVTYSHILKHIQPLPDDTFEKFSKLVKTYKISERRLYEYAMFNPSMIPFVGAHLNIPSFESGCYFFISHMNETLSDEQYSIVAKYTSLSKEELQQGAIALDWFRGLYANLGDKIFNQMYDSAKYISNGAKHARARKYSDAILGKVVQEEIEKEIEKNRNKDLLMSYPLIPIEKKDFEKTLVQRYVFLQKFSNESKKFGAQRQQSERLCLEVAYNNLSQAAGYTDVNRLFLNMESLLLDDLNSSFNWTAVPEKSKPLCWVRINVNEDGIPCLECTKELSDEKMKIQKSIPAAVKKSDLIFDFQEKVKRLKNQHSRTKKMLEDFMCSSVEISMGEIDGLLKNPVVRPLVSKLIFIAGGVSGFATEKETLVDFNGKEHLVNKNAMVRVAHCFDFYDMEIWHSWQKYICDKKIVQPFKQVFRELYVKLDEEKQKSKSMMFSGYQLQPNKTKAALRTRNWIASYDDGLCKIFHKENIVANIYAVCDWFSPSDIEYPTLEYVYFSQRICNVADRGKDFSIADVPDIVYSEIMRDVDLAISVGHAGSVDPETSHSTIEMRKSIIEFVLPMFGIKNVTIEKNFAFVKGVRGEYQIHLGTGLIHKVAGTPINVLAVPAQHRGKIFLPFADEDPKTAEVLTKLIMFARDGEIRDPSILQQI